MSNYNDIYVVNPAYKFKNDLKRVELTNNTSLLLQDLDENSYDSGFSRIMHPYIAYIFSFFDGKRTLQQVYEKLTEEVNFDISLEDFALTIAKFVENNGPQIIPIAIAGAVSVPKHFLINNPTAGIYRPDLLEGIDIHAIMSQLDLSTVRNYIPSECTIMLNDTCCTNCIYCYADRSHQVKNLLPFNRLKDIIKEAHDLGMRSFAVDGGDFFLYPHWFELLQELRKYGYVPIISTKFPITKEIVDKLLVAKIRKIQLSLDSVNNEEIMQILKVDAGYLERVKKGVALLNDAGIAITFKPVITKYNDSLESVENLIRFAAQFENVELVNVTAAERSQFKPFNYPSTRTRLKLIEDKIPIWKEKYKKNINMLGYATEVPVETKKKNFPKRSFCSGNLTGFFVLPDGKVTLCEQLYWHPFFLIGDLSRQSIMEMWQSEKALSLWNFSQDEVRDCSPCKTCSEFDACRRGLGNCWRIAVATYGPENYDFPAPNCPRALPEPADTYIPE